jgi:hypothetical protein
MDFQAVISDGDLAHVFAGGGCVRWRMRAGLSTPLGKMTFSGGY